MITMIAVLTATFFSACKKDDSENKNSLAGTVWIDYEDPAWYRFTTEKEGFVTYNLADFNAGYYDYKVTYEYSNPDITMKIYDDTGTITLIGKVTGQIMRLNDGKIILNKQ